MTRSIKNEQNEIYKMKESHKIPVYICLFKIKIKTKF